MPLIELSIIIVNLNTKELLCDCLQSIYQTTKNISFEVIVVDNGSTDGSIQAVGKFFPKVNVIKNTSNLGFSRANNQGIKLSKGKYFLLLNSDTIVLDSALEKMVNYLDLNKDVGVLSCQLLNPDRTLQITCASFPTLFANIYEMTIFQKIFPGHKSWKDYTISDWDRTTPREVDTICGACFIIRREVIEKVGTLDENIFLYFEEHEFCYRVKKAGFKIMFIPEAKIIHLKGKSSGLYSQKEIGEFYKSSMYYFYKKHYGFFRFLILKSVIFFNQLFIFFTYRLKTIFKS